MAFDAELAKKPAFMDFNAYMKVPPEPVTYKQAFAFQLGCRCSLCAPRQPPPYISRKDAIGYLKAARARIERGWCQGGTYDARTKGVCAMGALICAVTGAEAPTGFDYTVEVIINELAKMLPGMCGIPNVISYNDYRGRTKAEVLALFDGGIAALERDLKPTPAPRPLYRFEAF